MRVWCLVLTTNFTGFGITGRHSLGFVDEDTFTEKGSPTSDVGGTVLRSGVFKRKEKEEESEQSTNIHHFFASGPDPVWY